MRILIERPLQQGMQLMQQLTGSHGHALMGGGVGGQALGLEALRACRQIRENVPQRHGPPHSHHDALRLVVSYHAEG